MIITAKLGPAEEEVWPFTRVRSMLSRLDEIVEDLIQVYAVKRDHGTAEVLQHALATRAAIGRIHPWNFAAPEVRSTLYYIPDPTSRRYVGMNGFGQPTGATIEAEQAEEMPPTGTFVPATIAGRIKMLPIEKPLGDAPPPSDTLEVEPPPLSALSNQFGATVVSSIAIEPAPSLGQLGRAYGSTLFGDDE